MSEDWEGRPQSDPGDELQGGGKPRPYISGNLSTNMRNVGAGLAPALQTPSPQNPTLQAFLEGLSKLG